MMAYRIIYSETSRDQIISLHPQIKPIVKSHIQKLKENPYLGISQQMKKIYNLCVLRDSVVNASLSIQFLRNRLVNRGKNSSFSNRPQM